MYELQDDLLASGGSGGNSDIPDDNAAFDLIGLTKLRQDSKYDNLDGSGIGVAVIDTGIDYNNSLLESNYITGYDFANDDKHPLDEDGHGTEVAGIIGANDDRLGIAPEADLIGLQVFDGNNATDPNIEKALQWTLENHEKYNILAINLSLGDGFYTSVPEAREDGDILYDDIKKLEKAGVTIIASAGNDYKNNEYQNLSSPAIYSTLAVGAVWQDGANSQVKWTDGAEDLTTGADRLVSFSQRFDSSNMIFAPGALITTTTLDEQIEETAGTSMAAPMVTGAVVLMQEAAKEYAGHYLSPKEIKRIIRSTADIIKDGDDENDNVENTGVSYRRLNVYKAVDRIRKRYSNSTQSATLVENNLLGQTTAGNSQFNFSQDNLIYNNGILDRTTSDYSLQITTSVDF